jgi:hypothetical protein
VDNLEEDNGDLFQGRLLSLHLLEGLKNYKKILRTVNNMVEARTEY